MIETVSLALLRSDDFLPLLGSQFVVHLADKDERLTLTDVQPGKCHHPGLPREPFSLILEGARTDVTLMDGMHLLAHPVLGNMSVYMAPRARTVDGRIRYQVIFN